MSGDMRVDRVSRNDYDNSSVAPVKMQKKQKINSIHLEAAAGANAPVRTAFMPDLPSLLNGSQNTNTASYT